MNNGETKALRQIAGKRRRACVFLWSGETKLIVYDDVDGPTHPVTAQMPHIQGLSNHPFTRKGGITMNQDWQRMIHILHRDTGLVAVLLPGASHALNDRIHKFEVAGIGR